MYFLKGNLITGNNKRVHCISVGVYKHSLHVYVVN